MARQSKRTKMRFFVIVFIKIIEHSKMEKHFNHSKTIPSFSGRDGPIHFHLDRLAQGMAFSFILKVEFREASMFHILFSFKLITTL